MLEGIFFSVVKMSVSASFIAVVALVIKYILQKAGFSRSIMMILWLLIAFKLVCPFSPQSSFSVFNLFGDYENKSNHAQISHSIFKNNFDTPQERIQKENKKESLINETSRAQYETKIIAYIWILGFNLMLAYLFISWLMLKRRLRFALRKHKGIYMSEEIGSSFVFGLIKPCIYIPSTANEENIENMIAHEKMHIKRLDHITKVAAWIILSCHWFNPFVWLMYDLFSKDVEYACDEAVIKAKGNKCLYMKSLLNISAKKEKQNSSPLICSFENGVKKRVKNLAGFKRPTLFSKLVSFLVCVGLCLTLGTVGTEAKNEILELKSHAPYKELKLPNLNPVSFTDVKEETKRETHQITPEYMPAEQFKYKTNFVSDDLYVGFETLEYDNISIKDIEENLQKGGYLKTNDGADLKDSYITGSIAAGESICHSKLKCDKNGNISLFLKLNTESHISALIYDSSTGIVKDGGSFIANGKNVYSFIGFEPQKTYDIVIKSSVGSEWKIHGEYIIY